MNDSEFKRIYRKYGIEFTDTDLIDSAFYLTLGFSDWQTWLNDMHSSFGRDVTIKLATVADEILKSLPPETDGISCNMITPERYTANRLKRVIVPISFLEFLTANRPN